MLSHTFETDATTKVHYLKLIYLFKEILLQLDLIAWSRNTGGTSGRGRFMPR